MNDEPTYLTVSDAALWLGCSERTIRRWMTARLLTIYKRGDGRLVFDVAELGRVERAQRGRNPARAARRTLMFAQVAAMSYPRE